MRRTAWPGILSRPLMVILVCALPVCAQAQQDNRLRRVQIRPHQGFTRVNLYFQSPPDYRLTTAPGRVRISFRDADSPSFKRLRGYSDPHLGGLFCSQRYHGFTLEIPVKEPGWAVEPVSVTDPTLLSIDIGPSLARTGLRPDIVAGREAILSGTEKFVREFQVPTRAGLPFEPTDSQLLKRLLPDEEGRLFQRAEGLLYRDQASEALEIFNSFLAKAPAVRALAWYRMGESLAVLDRNAEALAAFKEGEAIWPAYLEQAPQLELAYAETRAKNGDFAGGREMLSRLMARFAGTVYAAPLLGRMALMWERHGEIGVADSMYRTLAAHAPGTVAAARARMKLADREMFSLSRDRYRELLARYRAVYDAPGDFGVRDEALFKMALLQALYGAPREALDSALSYETCYPRGIFSTVVKGMHEELLLPVYRELAASKDDAKLARLALDNREYLERCFSDPGFPATLADAFRRAGLLTRELELFGYLADRSWAAPGAAVMTSRMVEDALTLGNLTVAESAGRNFLSRFPKDPRGGRVREELGRVAFEKGDLKGVAEDLSFLEKGGKPEFVESGYYLGKALASAGDQRGAERALARFTLEAPPKSPLLPDGYFTLAGARVALRDYQGGISAYRAGAKIASGEMADQFLYKLGELYLQLKDVHQAKESWEQVASRGGNGTWVKLAQESLSDLNWRLKIAGELP